MNKDFIQKEVLRLSRVEDWNHYYEFPYGIITKEFNNKEVGSNILKWKRILPILKDLNVEGKTVLDVGCSDGFFSIETARLGARNVLGVDPDRLRVERGNFAKSTLNVDNVEFECGDLFDWISDNKSYDVVLALGILHRIPDMYSFLDKLTKLGKKIILEFKSLDTNGTECMWAGGQTKGNSYNKLFFIPSKNAVSQMLRSLGFVVDNVYLDTSNLKHKRTIIVASKENLVQNHSLADYKDIHKGKRVFLIGNGPSLADTDLSLLENEYSIAMNRIALIYPKFKNWRPTYYLFSSTNVSDNSWGDEWLSSVHDAVSESATTAFIASDFKKRIDPSDEFPSINWFDSLSETRPGPRGEISEYSFSTNVVERIDKSGTSMSIALQLAFHMGFSEIVLLGADLGWSKDLGSRSDPNHFDKNYRANISNPYKANFQMRNVHRLALSKFMKLKPDVRIYNASVRTVLDTYPIINFKEFVKAGKVVLREADMQSATDFWKNQTYPPSVKRSLYRRIFGKVKWLILGYFRGK